MNNVPNDSDKPMPSEGDQPAAEVVQDMLRSALTGSLATISKSNGGPYASLITCATTPEGNPIFLLSDLAVHTQNLKENPRAALLIDGTGVREDALTGNRVTLMGEVTLSEDQTVKTRFLSRHPYASFYAGFQDFGFYVLQVESAHFIGGFGRIIDIPFDDIAISVSDAQALIDAESSIIEHMNEDHVDSLNLYARCFLNTSPYGGSWRMTGIDPQGIDIVRSRIGQRLRFQSLIKSPEQAQAQLRALSDAARAQKFGEKS